MRFSLLQAGTPPLALYRHRVPRYAETLRLRRAIRKEGGSARGIEDFAARHRLRTAWVGSASRVLIGFSSLTRRLFLFGPE